MVPEATCAQVGWIHEELVGTWHGRLRGILIRRRSGEEGRKQLAAEHLDFNSAHIFLLLLALPGRAGTHLANSSCPAGTKAF